MKIRSHFPASAVRTRKLFFFQRIFFVLMLLTGAYLSGGCTGPETIRTHTTYEIPQPDGSTAEVMVSTKVELEDGKVKEGTETTRISLKIPGGSRRVYPDEEPELYKFISASIYQPPITGCKDDVCYEFQPFGDAELSVRPES